MDDPQIVIVGGGNRRGRPRVCPNQPSTDVHLSLPEGMYDKAFALASRDRISVPEVIRRALDRLLTSSNQ